MKLISIDGLIYWYKGEAKEYPPDTMLYPLFFLDCAQCEDQQTMIDLLPDEAFTDDGFVKDRTLYFVDVEFEEVGQMKRKTDKEWFTATHALINVENQEDFEYRTVARIKERKPKEESQEELCSEALEYFADYGQVAFMKKFHLTRKPTAGSKEPKP